MADEAAILERLRQAVIDGEEEAAREAATDAVAAGVDPQKAILDGLSAGMAEMGRLYEEEECYVPELMVSSEALYAGLEILKPLVLSSTGDGKKKGVVVIGVVQGDIHDIGKNLVKLMLEVNGFEIHDLGRDVEMERFIEECEQVEANLLCLSSLMTTTMIAIKDYMPEFKAKLPGTKIMIGGAPLNQQLADEWGADGYAVNAVEAARAAVQLMSVEA
jgi:corrinoid protein of di/trimethylamine methyltransferase